MLYDIVFYSMTFFAFCVLVWCVFTVAKYENYSKGYRHGWNKCRNDAIARMTQDLVKQQNNNNKYVGAEK